MLSLSGYKVLNCIYKGTSAHIYRAIRLSDERPVVIKVSDPVTLTEKKMQRFCREFEIGQQIHSPYVVRYLELRQDPAYGVALIMEDDNSVELTTFIPTEGVSNLEFLLIADQIVQGLKTIHDANIIHSDLKPSNILIQRTTHHIKIFDFNRASALQREKQAVTSVMLGTLAYISPEQTGRINRSVDYRTDFYSLGVTFYRMLCGNLPFSANDAMGVIHQHLAKQPQPPHLRKSSIAVPLSQIVMKLLEKEAEHRYQSCNGLLYDLTHCMTSLKEEGYIREFALGEQDFPNKLMISEHMYGRESEIDILLRTFEHVSHGKREALMVAGPPGVGKSMLIQEIQKSIALKQGYFLKGKFDQLNKNVAYSALSQAFNDFIKQLLTEDEASIARWKNQFLTALGTHAQFIIKVVPALALLIGEQPAAVIADINQAKNMFNWVFQKFVNVCVSTTQLLVVFLDDLQWADNASLELMTYLLQQPNISHLLWIGAYRDTEVTALYPTMQAIAVLQESHVCVQTLTLTPLSLESLSQWIADSLRMPLTEISTLAELIQQKTAGNPFFVKVFLQTLYDQGLLTFSGQKHWQWNLANIRQHPATENVVVLMAYQIQQLPPMTQKALNIASCLSHHVTLTLLQIAMAASPETIEEALEPALNKGILLKIDGEIQFAHDRLQEAAYQLVPETQRSQTHFTIGKLLLEHYASQEELLFNIVSQFNHCSSLIVDPQECLQMAHLYLKAGQKAKQATAYATALDYLNSALNLIDIDIETLWQTNYLLAFTLHKELAEVEFLSKHFESSEAIVKNMQLHLQSTLDKVESLRLLIIQKTVQGQHQEAITLGHQALKLLGSGLPLDNLDEYIQKTSLELKLKLENKSILSLLDVPLVVEPENKAIFKILSSIYGACYQTGTQLLIASTLMAVNLSLTAGQAMESCHSYAAYGLLLCSNFQEYALGYQFGNLALELANKLKSQAQYCKSSIALLSCIYPWSKSIQHLPPLLTSNYEASLACGEPEFAGYSAIHKIQMLFYTGVPLPRIQKEALPLLEFAHSTKNQLTINVIQAIQKLLEDLIGETTDESSTRNSKDIANFEEHCQRTKSFSALCLYYIHKALILYLFEQYDLAFSILALAKNNLIYIRGNYATANYNLYDSLTRLALYPAASKEDQQAHLLQVIQNQQQMQKWQSNCPENFAHKYSLVAAELARMKGDDDKAQIRYDQTIKLAGQHGFIHEQALAAELAAKYWLAKDKTICAQGYLHTAFKGYTHWDAKRKLMQFKACYSDWLHAFASSNLSQLVVNQETTLSSNSLKLLDLSSIIKALYTISREIELPKLLHSMMQIIIENAGAEKGAVLFIENDRTIVVQAEYAVDGTITTLKKIPLDNWCNGSRAVIQYVKRVSQSVVVENATAHEQFKTDSYIRKMQVKSILSIPLLKNEQLRAILYLENNLMPNAFTPERVQTVQILTTQMVISLENARYFAEQIALTRQLAEQSARAQIAEESLHAVTHDLQLALQASKAGTWNWQIGTDKVTWDDANYALFGFKTGDEFKETYDAVLERVHPDDRERLNQDVKRCLEEDVPHDMEYRVIWPDGSQHIISAHGRVYRDKNNRPIKMAGVCLDITQRKQLEQDRLEALKQTEEKERLRAQEAEKYIKAQEKFIDTVCHEIRNPLSAIYGNIDLLKEIIIALKAIKSSLPIPVQPTHEELLHKLEECIQVIELCIGHQMAIMNDVLNLSNLEDDKIVFASKPIQLKELVENTLRLFAAQLATKHLKLQLSLPKTEIIIKGDPDRFKSILMNLVSNAIKFTAQGEIHISLEAKDITPTSTALTLCVKDTGIGMTSQQQSLLFQRFSRPVSSQFGGSGLGLSIIKKTIDLMGGTIEVESEKGRGSKFTVKLTCKSVMPEARVTPLVDKKPVTIQPAASLDSKYILLVEDNVVIQKMLKNQLERLGHRCTVANNGQEALEKCEHDTFDLIFMDREMPVMDGIEGTLKIRARENELELMQTPIIGLSAYAREDLIKEALAAGMNDYLIKPAKTEQISEKIKQWSNKENIKGEKLHTANIATKEQFSENAMPPVKTIQEANAPQHHGASATFWNRLSSHKTWIPKPVRLILYPILDLLSIEVQSLGITINMPAEQYQARSSKTGWQLYAITGKDEYWAVLNLTQQTEVNKLVQIIHQSGTRLGAKKLTSNSVVPAIAITFSSQIALSTEIDNIKKQIRDMRPKVSSKLSQ